MAVTHGHGNPNWGRDEVLLALDLYFRCEGRIPSKDDPRVIALSDDLRRLPYHAEAARKPSFRNPDGVAFKLQNLRQIATGKGLGNVATNDRLVWAEFGKAPELVAKLATAIRAGIEQVAADEPSEDQEFLEGRLLTELHRRRERNPAVRKQLIATRRKSGKLTCDLCGGGSPSSSPELETASFEGHHLLGIAAGAERPTKLSDMALLHATCHRLVHAAIVLSKRWLTLTEARDVIRLK